MTTDPYRPACWRCEGAGYVTVAYGVDASHGNLAQEVCPVCEGEPYARGFLSVRYPESGHKMIVLWRTDHTGHQAIFVDSYTELVEEITRLVHNEPFAEILEGWYVEMVSPPKLAQQIYAQQRREFAQQRFWDWIGDMLALLPAEDRAALPIKQCTNYHSNDPDDVSWDEAHRYCTNCKCGVVFDHAVDQDAFYRARRDLYLADCTAVMHEVNKSLPLPLRPFGPSTAPPALDHEEVSVLFNLLVPRDCARIRDLETNDETELRSVCIDPPSAWFRKDGPVDLEPFLKMFADRQAAIGELYEQDSLAEQGVQNAFQKARMDAFLRIVRLDR